jgi:acylphosphatase
MSRNPVVAAADRSDFRAHVRLAGQVQGVGFRYSAAHEARRRRLSGWVRNLDSGGVEAVFQGPRAAVEDVVRWCNEGPPGAYVREVRVSWAEPSEPLSGFEIRPTARD